MCARAKWVLQKETPTITVRCWQRIRRKRQNSYREPRHDVCMGRERGGWNPFTSTINSCILFQVVSLIYGRLEHTSCRSNCHRLNYHRRCCCCCCLPYWSLLQFIRNRLYDNVTRSTYKKIKSARLILSTKIVCW